MDIHLQEAVDQGLKLHRAGRLAEAEPFYAAALRMQPDLPQVLHLMGLLRFHQKNFVAARALLENLVARQPDSAETLYYYGLTLAALGDTDAAQRALDRVIVQAPKNHPIVMQAVASRGDILLHQGRATGALVDFDRVLATNATSVAAWNNRGLALNALNRREEALASFDRALALAPDTVQAHNNHGDMLRALGRYNEALDSFGRALALDPRDLATLNNRAITLNAMGRIDEALADYDKALAIAPHFAQALHGRGTMLWAYKNALVPTIADMERLVHLAPDFPFGRGSLLGLKMSAVRWEDFKEQKAAMDAGVAAGRPLIAPLTYLQISDNPADLLACARLYAQLQFPSSVPMEKRSVRKPGRIRIGYVCGEFRTHAVLHLMAGLFEAHDKTGFEIFAFDNGGGDGSALRARFDAAVERIIDISSLSDQAAARLIRDKDIDILVDLNGYSGDLRLGIFTQRPAPVQVSYLAYPGTLGLPCLDYILADKVVIPEDEQAHYDEKIVWLPHSYMINDDKRAIAPRHSRAEENLPENAFVFCNFNDISKLTPASFTIWMRLLANIPNSVLWLRRPEPMAQENLRREAMMRSIDPDRLIFADVLAIDRHLARLALANLFLDSQPYGAHTTASDALWAGLPVLTMRGNSFAGRVASSLLTALELPELLTENPAAFVAMALRLAREPTLMRDLRDRLARQRTGAPLFDTARTTRAIERAYRMMLERQGAPPQSFAVPD